MIKYPKLPTKMLFVDDEITMCKRIQKESSDNTHLGVLIASDLDSACEYIDTVSDIDAILVDMNFREDAKSRKCNLSDGIDFISYAQSKRIDLPAFVITMEGPQSAARHGEATGKNVLIREWYDKLSANQPGKLTVCEQIERRLILDALKTNPGLRQEVGMVDSSGWLESDFADSLCKMLKYPRISYLQDMPLGSNLQILKPIEVLCQEVSAGQFVAKATEIGLLIELEPRDTPSEAIQLLAEAIEEEWQCLKSLPTDAIFVGYAKLLKERLDDHFKETNTP